MEVRPFSVPVSFLFVAGVVSVMGGSAAAQTAVPAWKVSGDHPNAGLASYVASAGDVDGDGYDEVLVAAYAHTNDQVREGRVQLFRGGPGGPAKLPAWSVESNQAFATLGPAAGVGDVNGDGYDDVVVGSYLYSTDEQWDGHAWLYLGSATGLGTVAAWNVDGDGTNVNLGSSVAPAGDVNGDGYADVSIGVVQYTNGQQTEGQVRIYLGSAAGLATTPAWSVEGNQAFCFFGTALAAGDVNADGYSDLLVGAWSFNAGETDEGRALLYLGSPAGPEALSSWTAEGNERNAYLGQSVAFAGDVNGDGFGDMLVGAPGIALGKGRAYLYLGSAAGLALTPAWTVTGSAPTELQGFVTGAGDLDGDGWDDVVIGSQSFFNGTAGEGRIAAYYGSASGLALDPGWTFEGNQRNANFGTRLGRAGDVNGDGFSDVIAGSELFDLPFRDTGRAFVFLGKSRARNP